MLSQSLLYFVQKKNDENYGTVFVPLYDSRSVGFFYMLNRSKHGALDKVCFGDKQAKSGLLNCYFVGETQGMGVWFVGVGCFLPYLFATFVNAVLVKAIYERIAFCFLKMTILRE